MLKLLFFMNQDNFSWNSSKKELENTYCLSPGVHGCKTKSMMVPVDHLSFWILKLKTLYLPSFIIYARNTRTLGCYKTVIESYIKLIFRHFYFQIHMWQPHVAFCLSLITCNNGLPNFLPESFISLERLLIISWPI